MRAGLVGRPRAKSTRYQPTVNRKKVNSSVGWYETTETAGALFRAGRLNDAVAAANAAVRKAPAELAPRILLAELLLFTGNFDRAGGARAGLRFAAAWMPAIRLARGRPS